MRLAPLALLAPLAVAALLAPSTAHASPANPTPDEMAFVNAVTAQGYGNVGGQYGLILASHQICDKLYQGYSLMQTAGWIYTITDLSIDSYDAGFLVGSAWRFVCPDAVGQQLA